MLLQGSPTDWPGSACVKPRCPSQAFHDEGANEKRVQNAAEELEKLLHSTTFEPRQSGLGPRKTACLHLKVSKLSTIAMSERRG